MKRLPWAKFTIRSTPKMIVSPAEMSHRYIASDRPMRPWKAMFSITVAGLTRRVEASTACLRTLAYFAFVVATGVNGGCR